MMPPQPTCPVFYLDLDLERLDQRVVDDAAAGRHEFFFFVVVPRPQRILQKTIEKHLLLLDCTYVIKLQRSYLYTYDYASVLLTFSCTRGRAHPAPGAKGCKTQTRQREWGVQVGKCVALTCSQPRSGGWDVGPEWGRGGRDAAGRRPAPLPAPRVSTGPVEPPMGSTHSHGWAFQEYATEFKTTAAARVAGPIGPAGGLYRPAPPIEPPYS